MNTKIVKEKNEKPKLKGKSNLRRGRETSKKKIKFLCIFK